jgi:hypothetical protein
MTAVLYHVRDTLARAGYSVERIALGQRDALLFEDDTYLGFVVVYPDVQSLHAGRETDSREFLAHYTPDLRAAGDKAWNTYFVWLAESPATQEEEAVLSLLEEDLSGTRKITASGVQSPSDVDGALVNLLPLQAPPRLSAVDIPTEIRARTTELDPYAVEAFLSDAPAEHVAKALQNLPS